LVVKIAVFTIFLLAIEAAMMAANIATLGGHSYIALLIFDLCSRFYAINAIFIAKLIHIEIQFSLHQTINFPPTAKLLLKKATQ